MVFVGVPIPIPEDLPLLWAGWAAHEGHMSLAVVALASYFGLLARDTIGFSLGRLVRHGSASPLVRRLIPERQLGRARVLSERLGRRAHLFGRFAIGVRVIMFMAAGLAGVRYRSFLVADAIALAIHTPLYLWLGWRFGPVAVDFLETHVAGRAGWVLLGLIGAFLALRWLLNWIRSGMGRKPPAAGAKT
jgi:undecaprenyl-diphosphatase